MEKIKTDLSFAFLDTFGSFFVKTNSGNGIYAKNRVGVYFEKFWQPKNSPVAGGCATVSRHGHQLKLLQLAEEEGEETYGEERRKEEERKRKEKEKKKNWANVYFSDGSRVSFGWVSGMGFVLFPLGFDWVRRSEPMFFRLGLGSVRPK